MEDCLPSIDVIVRTLADASRSSCLFRALDSIQSQAGVVARPIVVINGNRSDPSTLARLRARSGIVLHFEEQASLRLARVAGRRRVTADFFAYLDDDDELLPDSLRPALAWLVAHPDDGLVVTNGQLERADGSMASLTWLASVLRGGDPAEALLADNWLVPGAFVARATALTAELLGSGWNHMEWTHLAWCLCANGIRPHFIDRPGVVIHYSPGSLSRQAQHQQAALDLMALIARDARLTRRVRRMAREKAARLHHGLCMMALRGGQWRQAWKHHLLSLKPPRPFRYVLFTRRLMEMPGPSSKRQSEKGD